MHDKAPIAAFLERHASDSLIVPYRENRAVLFESRLFHRSDAPEFADRLRKPQDQPDAAVWPRRELMVQSSIRTPPSHRRSDRHARRRGPRIRRHRERKPRRHAQARAESGRGADRDARGVGQLRRSGDDERQLSVQAAAAVHSGQAAGRRGRGGRRRRDEVQARRPRAADGGVGGLCRVRRDAGGPVHQAAAVAAVRGSRVDGAGLRHRLFRAEGSRADCAWRNRAGAWRDRRRRPRRDPIGQGDGRQGVRRGRQQGQGGHRAGRRRRRDRRSVGAGPA